MYKFSKLACCTLFLSIFLSVFNLIHSSDPIKIASIQNDKDLLKGIALTIAKRLKDIEYIGDKICTHGPEVLDVWR